MKKRVISLAVCLCLVLCLVPVAARMMGKTREPLKILAIGSSFGVDGIARLASVAEAEGMGDIVLGNLYAGACTLNRHARNAYLGSEYYYYYKFDSRTNTNGQWDTAVDRVMNGPNDVKSAATIDHGLLDEEWDIIVMQQSAAEGGRIDTFNKDMTTLITHVQEKCPDAKLYWHMTWAFPEAHADNEKFIEYHNADTMTMYQGIVEAMNGKIVPSGGGRYSGRHHPLRHCHSECSHHPAQGPASPGHPAPEHPWPGHHRLSVLRHIYRQVPADRGESDFRPCG